MECDETQHEASAADDMLRVRGQGRDRWQNELDTETGVISELPPVGVSASLDERVTKPPRVVFAKGENPITGNVSYSFAGVYQFQKQEGDVCYYERIQDEFRIMTPGC